MSSSSSGMSSGDKGRVEGGEGINCCGWESGWYGIDVSILSLLNAKNDESEGVKNRDDVKKSNCEGRCKNGDEVKVGESSGYTEDRVERERRGGRQWRMEQAFEGKSKSELYPS